MSAGVAARPIAEAAGLRPALAVLAIGAALLLLLFRAEAAAAVQIWRSSTAYGHCFLVLPVAAWLAWERRGALAVQDPRPWPLASLAALPLAAAWFLAERLGVMEGRQLVAVALLLVLALSVLGRRLWWAFAVPLLYLFFLVPFGDFLVRPLQTFTARFIDVGLDALGIAHVVTAFVIEIPEGTFRVAEACAGLRFLIAAIAFGVVYACVIYRSPGRRIAFVAASVVVPIVANGLRALGIVVLGHVLGSAQAASVDHLLYGWTFFSVVILLLILAGLPFREDMRNPAPRVPLSVPTSHERGGHLLVAACAVLLLSAAFPSASAMLERRADREQASMPADLAAGVLATVMASPGCRPLAPGRFDCSGVPIAVTVQAFAAHTSPAALIGARRAATGEFSAEESSVSTWILRHGQPRSWQVTETTGPDRLIATSLWIGGSPEPSGFAMRLRQACASVLGNAADSLLLPVLVTVSAVADDQPGKADSARETLRRFLDQQTLAEPGTPQGTSQGTSRSRRAGRR